jgi:hypothetical protein
MHRLAHCKPMDPEVLAMRTVSLTIPKLAYLAATRGLLGAGIGLLTSQRLKARRRRNVGRALLAIGILTTIPLARQIFFQRS